MHKIGDENLKAIATDASKKMIRAIIEQYGIDKNEWPNHIVELWQDAMVVVMEETQ